MVASSTIFKTPTHPFFFLQEFKKAKGEKRGRAANRPESLLCHRKRRPAIACFGVSAFENFGSGGE